MAKSFNVKNTTINSQYEYKNDVVVVNGNYAKNDKNELQNVNGSVYDKKADGSMGDNIGSFNGFLSDGVIKYSVSNASIGNLEKIENAIQDIDAEITKEN